MLCGVLDARACDLDVFCVFLNADEIKVFQHGAFACGTRSHEWIKNGSAGRCYEAAYNLGRDYILIEQEQEYYNICVERMKRIKEQTRLF